MKKRVSVAVAYRSAVVAAVLVLSACGQADDVTVPGTTSEPPPSTARPATTSTTIDTDLSNGELPAGSCDYGTTGNRGPIALSGGFGVFENAAGIPIGDWDVPQGEVVLDGPAEPVDLDGDGMVELLQRVDCKGQVGGGPVGEATLGLVLEVMPATLVLVGGSPVIPVLGEDGAPSTVVSITADGASLVVEELVTVGDETYPGEVIWALDGGTWTYSVASAPQLPEPPSLPGDTLYLLAYEEVGESCQAIAAYGPALAASGLTEVLIHGRFGDGSFLAYPGSWRGTAGSWSAAPGDPVLLDASTREASTFSDSASDGLKEVDAPGTDRELTGSGGVSLGVAFTQAGTIVSCAPAAG